MPRVVEHDLNHNVPPRGIRKLVGEFTASYELEIRLYFVLQQLEMCSRIFPVQVIGNRKQNPSLLILADDVDFMGVFYGHWALGLMRFIANVRNLWVFLRPSEPLEFFRESLQVHSFQRICRP